MSIKITFEKKNPEYVLPLIVKDRMNSIFMIVRSDFDNKIYQIGFVSGRIYNMSFKTIEEYFDSKPDMTIIESVELIIK